MKSKTKSAVSVSVLAVMDASGYRALLSRLDAESPGEYVTDECVDRENVLEDGRKETDPDFWLRMVESARLGAEMRLDDIRAALAARGAGK